MMATRQVYTCDRCGEKTDVGWFARLRWTSFYLFEWNEEKHLCPSCKDAFNAFMEGKDVSNPAGKSST
jgi:hypothetical protein